MKNKKRILEIEKELKELDGVSTCSYNNDGLFNELRIMKEKLKEELNRLKGEVDGSQKDR